MLGPMEILVIVSTIGLWIFTLVDILRNEFTGNNKLIWVLVVLFGSVVGAILYFLIGSKRNNLQNIQQIIFLE